MNTKNHEAEEMLKAEHEHVQKLFADFEALSDRSKVSKKRLSDQICTALRLHSELEEQVFYPALRSAGAEEDLMDEALVEHAAAKALITEIEQMDADDDLYDAKVKVLSEQIDHHVREEEEQMFAQARSMQVDQADLAEQMKALRQKLAG